MSNRILAAATVWAETVAEMHPFSWDTLTCGEIEDFVALLLSVGRDDVAEMIVENHASGDEEGDLHYQGVSEWAHRYHREDDGEMECAECGPRYAFPADTDETCPSSPLHPDAKA